jgi:hypothetical protein
MRTARFVGTRPHDDRCRYEFLHALTRVLLSGADLPTRLPWTWHRCRCKRGSWDVVSSHRRSCNLIVARSLPVLFPCTRMQVCGRAMRMQRSCAMASRVEKE